MYWSKRLLQSEQNSESIPEKLSFSKNEIAKFYQLPSEASPHRAQAGVDHLIACYKAVTNAKWTVES
jgi:DNA polymerase-3 subunit epsilon/oligoribonuclease